MNKVFKYLTKLCRSFDISPIGSSSFPKILFYIVWGINSAVFLGEDFIQDQLFNSHTYDVVKSAVNCTVVKKVSADAYVNDSFEFVNTYEFCEASSIKQNLVDYGVSYVNLSRGPPDPDHAALFPGAFELS